MAKIFSFFFVPHWLDGKEVRMDEKYPPSDSDIEQVVDEARQACGLGPAPRSPQQGIKDMDARIDELMRLKDRLLARANHEDTLGMDVSSILQEIDTLNLNLAEARARRIEYETLLHGQN